MNKYSQIACKCQGSSRLLGAVQVIAPCEKQGDGKHRLYNGASWRQAPGSPAPREALRQGREGIHELASWMPLCRGDACHRLAASAFLTESNNAFKRRKVFLW